ncbi:DUF4391 domain-containing protein [Cyclobacterium xiamenense]|uniref:DUF4391 domain-containing protein n=1 Tax=Cyclobacterium xiamenense TaxID=1297121 RepID=UPI0035CF63BA
MEFFNLPVRTRVGKVVPKNAFDQSTNTKQKKIFADYIRRITWTHKLSPDTINLNSQDIEEIQVFKVELKIKSNILKILEIINKSIPYHIVFWVEFEDHAYISASMKHPHPTNNNISVIDWTFNSAWFKKNENKINLTLKGSLDSVFKDLCVKITGKPELGRKSMAAILQNQEEIKSLKGEIRRIKSAITKSSQFNEKVELNLKLKKLEHQMKIIE